MFLSKDIEQVILQAIWPTYVEFMTEDDRLANILWENETLYLIAN